MHGRTGAKTLREHSRTHSGVCAASIPVLMSCLSCRYVDLIAHLQQCWSCKIDVLNSTAKPALPCISICPRNQALLLQLCCRLPFCIAQAAYDPAHIFEPRLFQRIVANDSFALSPRCTYEAQRVYIVVLNVTPLLHHQRVVLCKFSARPVLLTNMLCSALRMSQALAALLL